MLAALDPGAPAHAAASAFCAQLRAAADAWRVCLLLAANAARQPNARFVALQQLEDLLVSQRYTQLPPEDRQVVRSTVYTVVSTSVTTNTPISPANFLRNKFIHVLVLLMRNDYIPHPVSNSPPDWPTFFTDFLSLPRTPVFVQTFLHLCTNIHDEIASREMSYSPQTHTANILIKDSMRAQGIPAILVQSWFQILSESLQSNDTNTAALCLKCIGLYASWIDAVQLVLSNSGFIDALFGFLGSNSSIRIGALNCLMGIVDKGMLVPDKLAVFDMLGATTRVMDLIAAARPIDGESSSNEDGEDFSDLGCKFINLVGMELCLLWQTIAEQKALATSPEAGILKSRILKHLQLMLPHAVRVLRSEYDDTSALAFPFLDEYLKILKVCKRDGALENVPSATGDPLMISKEAAAVFVDESLVGMLGVIVKKMQYDEDEEYDFDGEGGEDEALFFQVRQTLRSKMEVISSIDAEMFFSHFSTVLTNTFDAILMANQCGQRVQDRVRWSEAELALHLLFIYRGPFVYIDPETSAPTALSTILVKMMQSNISAYPHPSIPVVFFENAVKFAIFYNTKPEYLPQILEAFVDTRGLHNSSSVVRSRVYYLFMRFVKEQKELRDKLKVFASKLVEAIQDILYITPPQMQQPGVLANAVKQKAGVAIYANQLYVYEAVGFLISLDSDASKQEQLLQYVLTPLMTSMQEILDKEVYKLDTPDNLAVTNYLRQLITAVGSVGKGFPDFDSTTRTVVSSPLWANVFKQALHRIIMVLQRLNAFDIIRDAARFAFQRLIGCVGAEILPFFQPLISAGLFSQCTTKELANFLPSVDLLMHKFKSSFSTILNEIFAPLVERIFYFLNQSVSGFDELNEMNDLRRSYFNLMNNVFVHTLSEVLVSPTNMPHLTTILQHTLLCANDPSDPTSQKLALSLLSKMVAGWGSEASNPLCKPNGTSLPPQNPSTTVINGLSHSPLLENVNKWKGATATPLVPPQSRTDKKVSGTGGKEVIAIGLGGLTPVPQFSQFIYNSITPLLFEIPRNPKFNIADGAAHLVVFEIANLHKTILIIQGVEYLKVLEEVCVRQFGWDEGTVRKFEVAIVELTTRELQTALKKSFVR
ncbi:armadillo-type protein [Obelidium mucronatum]|nr:armadillo-type protein [Obelidium mucronatum]